MIYLDNNATTPVDPAVIEAMLPFLREHFANPSSAYRPARLVRRALDRAHEQVAALIGAQAEEIVFTSCGTESNNAAIASARLFWPRRKRLVVAATEHAAVLEPARQWQADGGEVVWLKVNRAGLLDPEALRAAVSDGKTALVSIMWANNETGVLAPVAELASITHEAGALFHTDAVQAAGKLPMDVTALGIDFLSLSGHKFHAPKGVGALYASRRVRFQPLLLGGGQEHNRRSGTENMAGIVGLGVAAELAQPQEQAEVRAMRDAFEARVMAATGAGLNGHPELRLHTTSSLSFPGIDAAGLLILLDERGLCCSAGSACHAANVHPSHVLEAMGYTAAHAASTLRFSFSRFNTMDEARQAADLVIAMVARMQALLGDSPVICG